MERGSEFSSHHKHAKYTAGSSLAAGSSGMNLVNTNDDFLNNHPTNMPNALSYANINTVQTTTNKREGRQCGGAVREQDQYMPIANVIRIMRRVLPPHAKISDEAKETVQECVSEFISFITGEANDRCQREQRKTITAEDVLWAMAKLGFDDYLEPLSLFLTRHRENENQGCSSMHDLLASLKRSAATAAAAAAADCVCVPSAAMMMPSMMPAAGNFQMGDQQWQLGMDAAAASALPGGFHTPAPPPPPPAASGDAGQDGFSNYDSYAQYKRQ